MEKRQEQHTFPADGPSLHHEKVEPQEYSQTSETGAQLPPTGLDKEPPSEKPPDTGIPYSVFTTRQKKMIVLSGAIGAVFSPTSTTIYLPALNTLADDLHVSNDKINLTITTFLILQGVAPMMVAGFSDTAGRRPAYLVCFIIYIAANIGLALQRDYAALMVLRCLQSAGSSGTVALAYGVTADITTSAERGVYVAYTAIPSMVGPILGPILGGLISQYLGWPWIFWFLTIVSSTYFIFFLLFFPETCRKVVGDGSLNPPLINRDLTSIIRDRNRRKNNIPVDEAMKAEVAKSYKLTFPNPLSTLSVIADRGSALILFCAGLVVACMYAINTGIPSQFGSIYHFNDIRIGLVFIPFGAGSIISAFTTGKLIDWNWRRVARANGFPVHQNRHQDLTLFPVERARLQIGLPLLYLGGTFIIIFGWLLSARTALAGPCIALFFAGYGLIAAFQILQILMVDLNPGRAASATAANNLFRCLLGAGATSVVGPMIGRMGVGGTYTFIAGVWLLFSPLLFYLMRVGPRWRREKVERKERKRMEEEKEEEEKRVEREGRAAGDV